MTEQLLPNKLIQLFDLDRLQVHESSAKLSTELIQTCLAKDSKDNISCVVIKLDQYPAFSPVRYHADIELEAKLSSKIDKFVQDYHDGHDICIEDLYISCLDDADLKPPPGSGMFVKFPFIKNQLRKLEPDLVSDSDDESTSE